MSGKPLNKSVSSKKTPGKVLLIILDGYGKTQKNHGNAITSAKKPYIDELRKKYPTTLLSASGNAVGLPQGYMGNSEVGHFTLGAGRIVFQSLERINQAINNGDFYKNPALLQAIHHAQKHNSKLHLIGLVSDKGVHSHIDHLKALLKLAQKHDLKKIYIHAFTDGRDVGEKTAKNFIKKIFNDIRAVGVGKIATIIGRFYSMDRDKNWQRTRKSYELLTGGAAIREKDPLKAIDKAYKRGAETDYYIEPILLDSAGLVEKNDALIFFNFRTDRAAQLTAAFTEKNFTEFKTKKIPLCFVCMGPYSKICPVAFPATKIKNNLGEIISKHNLNQLRIAETEKYAHVTFFFNSQIKTPWQGETRILIHSSKVPSYAAKPEMRAPEITTALIKEFKKNKNYDLIVLNYANGDLVGHSGDLKPTIKCIEVLDEYLKKLIPEALKKGYEIILTADHGNAEQMFYPDGSPCPSHTTNPVECTLISQKFPKIKLKKGRGLQDIAATILDLMNLKKPQEMTGESLITKKP